MRPPSGVCQIGHIDNRPARLALCAAGENAAFSRMACLILLLSAALARRVRQPRRQRFPAKAQAVLHAEIAAGAEKHQLISGGKLQMCYSPRRWR